MKARLIIIILVFAAFMSVDLAYSEEQSQDIQAPVQGKDNIDTQWVWGEVSGLDKQNNTVNLKYLDYATDQEKEMLITLDSSTALDNFKSLDEISPNESLSVDYVVINDKNIAKNISLERPENAPLVPKSEDKAVNADASVTDVAETSVKTGSPESSPTITPIVVMESDKKEPPVQATVQN